MYIKKSFRITILSLNFKTLNNNEYINSVLIICFWGLFFYVRPGVFGPQWYTRKQFLSSCRQRPTLHYWHFQGVLLLQTVYCFLPCLLSAFFSHLLESVLDLLTQAQHKMNTSEACGELLLEGLVSLVFLLPADNQFFVNNKATGYWNVQKTLGICVCAKKRFRTLSSNKFEKISPDYCAAMSGG